MLEPVEQSVYPKRDSLEDAIRYVQSQLVNTNPNQVFGLLMVYHNTLLSVLSKQDKTVSTLNKILDNRLWVGIHEDGVTVSDLYALIRPPVEIDFGDEPIEQLIEAVDKASEMVNTGEPV
jgi:hypothetical protein